ncbi:response regulator [Paenibacillus albidus]|uniref:response regulator transcription factor n=1 Tax=Paenibacillus albidus TaxID=2041023 RepID=UPI001BEC778A|nr:response regulator [Paenibacillus albidus]MBT2292724.1 response regulator [Paenibacillus albidus]
MNIMIVEDDRSLNKVIALTLAQNDVVIHQAYDISSAEHIIAVHPVDLIILDINLPDGSGLDYCEQLRKRHCDQFGPHKKRANLRGMRPACPFLYQVI